MTERQLREGYKLLYDANSELRSYYPGNGKDAETVASLLDQILILMLKAEDRRMAGLHNTE